eukprot:TRINITY_DN1592_c0_g2_i3.p1 TRINITY_DN1592_c0_g2~~TRINITY_DN1592_c0_g2_i3.p1  ORF type:complete len:344 (-),score=117.73 TRINITY_DN1592_c0_g2_i3:674-1705(-)
MGCGSSTPSDKEQEKTNRQIDAELAKERKQRQDDVKILLLGTGESGKSTFFKQMKILSEDNNFTSDQLAEYIPAIQANLVTQMKVLITAAGWLNLPIDKSNSQRAQAVLDSTEWSPELGKDIKVLWKDKGIQQTYEQRNKFQLNDSANYFFDNIERFLKDFEPTLEDVLRVRVRTTGIEEADFTFSGMKIRMIDVGGQRSERRKWIHCFDCVTTIIFFSSLSDYDQKLREDENVNRMNESITLFSGVCNISHFDNLPFVLFLNKLDLFNEKIKKVDLRVCFDDYTGGCNPEPAKVFIQEKFLANKGAHAVHTHFTVAVDTKNIEFVFASVKETLLKEALNEMF